MNENARRIKAAAATRVFVQTATRPLNDISFLELCQEEEFHCYVTFKRI